MNYEPEEFTDGDRQLAPQSQKRLEEWKRKQQGEAEG